MATRSKRDLAQAYRAVWLNKPLVVRVRQQPATLFWWNYLLERARGRSRVHSQAIRVSRDIVRRVAQEMLLARHQG